MEPFRVRKARGRVVARTVAGIIGIGILVLLIGQLCAPAVVSSHLLRYRAGESDRELVVTIGRGRCEKVKDTRAQEDASSVRLAVLVEQARGTCTADIVFEDVVFRLASPLAGRGVFDAIGAPLPTASPGS